MKVYKMNEKEKNFYRKQSVVLLIITLFTSFLIKTFFFDLFYLVIFLVLGPVFFIIDLYRDAKEYIVIENSTIKVYFKDKIKKQFEIDETKISLETLNNIEQILFKSNGSKYLCKIRVLGKTAFDELKMDFNLLEKSYIEENSTDKKLFCGKEVKRVLSSALRNIVIIVLFITFGISALAFYDLELYSLGTLMIFLTSLVVIIPVTISYVTKKNRIKSYVKDNKEKGFLHIPYNLYRKYNIDFYIINQPDNFQGLLKADFDFFYNTYILNSGNYKINICFVKKGSNDDILKMAEKVIEINIETDKYYILKYDKDLEEYIFNEEFMPRKFEKYIH